MFARANPRYGRAMRLILLICLTMSAFAANSLLNRLAVEAGAADPTGFAAIRVASGAAMLSALVMLRGGKLAFRSRRRVAGAGALSLYMIGFSLAYLTLDAGLGALILFGVVQITMIALSTAAGAPATARQIAGAGIALAGLGFTLWPAGDWSVDPAGAALMGAAGIGWALYTRAGQGATDPLPATAANFCLAVPLTLLAMGLTGGGQVTGLGAALAVLSGAVTSGLGYALWYAILPRLAPATAGTVQLSVPVLAMIGGVLLLGEAASLRLALGAAVVLGGIGLSLRRPTAR